MSDCGSKLQGKSGEVTSPGFPSPYPTESTCVWTIRVDSKSAIELDMKEMDIERSKKCRYDSLTIYDGANVSGNVKI